MSHAADRSRTSSTWRAPGRLIRLAAAALWLTSAPALAALELGLTAAPDPVMPGETMTVRLQIGNSGTGASGDLVLELPLPADFGAFSDTAITGGGTCPGGVCSAGETVTWTVGTLAPGEARTFSLATLVSAGAVPGATITLDARLLESGLEVATASARPLVAGDRALNLALAPDRDPVAPGQPLTWRLVFGNRTPATLIQGARLTLPVPAGMVFVAASDGGTLVGDTVEWDLGTLLPGDHGERTAVLQAPAAADGSLFQATATLSGGGESARSVRGGHLAGSAPLSLAVSPGTGPVRPQEHVDAQLTVTNHSGLPRSQVLLQLRYPEADSIHDALISGGGTCPGGVCSGRELVTWDLGTLAPGQAVTVSLPPGIPGAATDATLIALDAELRDGAGAGANALAVVPVDTDPVLALDVATDHDPAVPGGILRYTLVYGNRSAATLVQAATLALPVPEGTTFVAASDLGRLEGDRVIWDLGPLVPDQHGVRWAEFTVGPVADGTLLSARPRLEGDTHRAAAARDTAVLSQAPLAVAVDMNPDPVRPFEVLRGTVTVSNQSPFERNLVRLELRYPDDLDDLMDLAITGGASCPGGVCSGGELVAWDLGTLAPGQTVTLGLPPAVSGLASPGSSIPFELRLHDGAGTQVRARQAVPVAADPVLELALSTDRDPVPASGLVTYRLVYGNRSTATVAPAPILYLPVPAGAGIVSISGNGFPVGDTVFWLPGDLPPGAGGEERVVVLLDGSPLQGGLLAATASFVDAAGTPDQARAHLTTAVQDTAPLQVQVRARPGAAGPGDELAVDISVTNPTPFDRYLVSLRARVPEDVDAFSDTLTGGGTCGGGICDAQDHVTWELGTIPAGGTVTVSLPPVVSFASPLGTLIPWQAWALDGAGARALDTDVVRLGTAQIRFAMAVSGSCPGLVRVDVSGATPGGTVGVGYAASPGSTTLPGPVCAGLELDLANPALGALIGADGAGNGSIQQNLPASACGLYLQAVDVADCTPGLVHQVP